MPEEELMAFTIVPPLTQRLFIENPILGWPSVLKKIFLKLISANRSLPETNQVTCFLEKMRVCTRYILQLLILKPHFPTQISTSGSTTFPILQKPARRQTDFNKKL